MDKYSRDDYWKNYMERWFGSELIGQFSSHGTRVDIPSNNKHIGLEILEVDTAAPTLVFSHGIAGYARILLPFLIPLYRQGINIIAPDLEGYGYNGHQKGVFSWNHHVTNLTDTIRYAGDRFTGPLFVGGASMGGPLAYEAVSRTDCRIDGFVAWCLWNLNDPEFLEKETTFGKNLKLIIPFLKIASFLFGRLTVPADWAISYDTLTDDDEFNNLIRNDPQAGSRISLGAALSLVLQSRPSMDYASWKIPTLVFQPEADQMTPASYTRDTFAGLGSGKKDYVSIPDAAHFPTDPSVYSMWGDKVLAFIEEVSTPSVPFT